MRRFIFHPATLMYSGLIIGGALAEYANVSPLVAVVLFCGGYALGVILISKTESV